MSQVSQNLDLTGSIGGSIPGMHRFAHKAMATIYEIFIVHEDAVYAQQAAQEAFDELDRLEQELSRFLPNSDISRLNQLPAHQPLPIGLEAFECLQLSAHIFAETKGAFDITIGPLMKCWLNPDKTVRTPTAEELEQARQNLGMNLLELDEARHTVTLRSSPVHVDLGGMGKGYAIDVLARLLQEWEIDTALLHGGRSSVRALGAPPEKAGWPLTLSNPRDHAQILAHLQLRDQAVSGSGLQKGQHIIDPRTAHPLTGKRATWVLAPEGALTDALSTAFMVMPPEEVEDYCRSHQEIRAMIFVQDENEGREQVLRYGAWGEEAVS